MLNEKELLVFLDIGSRGEIPIEWEWFLKNKFKLKINTFDIDLNAELNQKENIEYVNHQYGLSSNSEPKEFYFCEQASQSSCYKPNKKINVFEKKHYEKRLNYRKVISQNITTIDSLFCSEQKIDFIKCDTQGSEFDISLGAKESLKKFCPIVALETWCENIYSNMPLDFKIRAFYREIGYQLFATDIAAAWRYDTNNLFPLSRQRLIGENLLFVPTLEMFDQLNENEIISKIPILCFFGFYDYAYNLLKRRKIKRYLPKLEKLYNQFSNKRKFHRRILQKLIGGHNHYPRIT